MIEVKRTELITVTTDDGVVMETGTPYAFLAGDKAYIGTFAGVSSRGSLCFEYEGTNFSFMPASIRNVKPLEAIIKTFEKNIGGTK